MSFFISASRVRWGVFCLLLAAGTALGDWPTYRHDNRRSGITDEESPVSPVKRWVYQPLHSPHSAWYTPAEELPRMHYDAAFQVSMGENLVFWGSSTEHTVHALDLDTGEEIWRFTAEGPVRFAPVYGGGLLYFGSDDGFVYALKAKSGSLVWKRRIGPTSEKLLGNGHMISRWPVRTSVLLEKDALYAGAGVFPHEGIYLCALSPKDGGILWHNGTMGDQSHVLDFGGFSPQSYLLASSSCLFVPSGRAMPVLFRKGDGTFKTWLSSGGKVGGAWALLSDQGLIAGVDRAGSPAKVLYDQNTGSKKGDAYAWFPGLELAVTQDIAFAVTVDGVHAIDRGQYPAVSAQLKDLEKERSRLSSKMDTLRNRLRSAHQEEASSIQKELTDSARRSVELLDEEEVLKRKTCRWVYNREGLRTLIVCGSTLVVGGEGVVLTLDKADGSLTWEAELSGAALGLALSDGALVVSSDLGTIHCFGAKKILGRPPRLVKRKILHRIPGRSAKSAPMRHAARSILKSTGIERGYCLCLGAGEGRLVEELGRRLDLQFVVLEGVHEKRQRLQEIFQDMGVYGKSVVIGDWSLSDLPDYFADLIISPDLFYQGKLPHDASEVLRLLKPCGGRMILGYPQRVVSDKPRLPSQRIASWMKSGGMERLEMTSRGGEWTLYTRGSLPGAGEWTHQYANTANTTCSNDERVTGQLSVLWFGEPGPEDMVDRHARGAAPLSMNGRLFIQGGEVVMAYDAYNGTRLWRQEIPGAVRVRVDVDGSNLALGEKGLFVALEDRCLCLDQATGKEFRSFPLPTPKNKRPSRWGYVASQEGLLVGSRAAPLVAEYAELWKMLSKTGEWMPPEDVPPQYRAVYQSRLAGFVESYPEPSEEARAYLHRAGGLWRNMALWPGWGREDTPEGTLASRCFTSDALFVMDPASGELLWLLEDLCVPHISITLSGDRIYFLDSCKDQEKRAEAKSERKTLIEEGVYQLDEETGVSIELSDVRKLVAVDIKTGEVLWERYLDLAGCGGAKIGVAVQDGVILFFGHYSNHDRPHFSRGTLRWRRILALDEKSKRILWSRPLNYLRRPLIVGDRIIIEPRACDLRTGQTLMRKHPISGQEVPFEFLRPGHSCGVTSASPHSIFYRSYCTAIYDLEKDAGLTLFGGIRPGCWVNLIPANGLLLFPEASSGCTCSFPLRCSLALKPVEKPRKAAWSVFIGHGPQTPARHLSLNLGAPGDRRDDDGTLWFGYPRPKCSYGVQYDLKESFSPGLGYFQKDPRGSQLASISRPWLYASGCVGLKQLSIPLVQPGWGEAGRSYTIRIGFRAESDDRPGQRVFDVYVGGKRVLQGLDAKTEGDANGILVKEIKGVSTQGHLQVEFRGRGESFDVENAPTVHWLEALLEGEEPLLAHVKKQPVSELREEDLCEEARNALDRGEEELSLALYHDAFNRAVREETLLEALKGMSRLGRPESMPLIRRLCKEDDPILREYRGASAPLVEGAIEVLVAVARNRLETERNEGIRMLREAYGMIHDEEEKETLRAELEALGYPIGSEAARRGLITRWLLLGPIPRGPGGYDEELSRRSVGEPLNAVKEGDLCTSLKLTWISHVSESGMVDLCDLYELKENATVYAYAEISLTKDEELLLKVGSDDSFKCWFNGKEAGSFSGGRGWQEDQDILRVQGRKGINKILIKVVQGAGDWAFSLKVTDAEECPLNAL